MLRDLLERAPVELPSRHLLRAALLSGRALTAAEGTPLVQLPLTWARTPSDGIFSPDDLASGFRLLCEARLVAIVDRVVLSTVQLTTLLAESEDDAYRVLMERLIDARRPLWVSAAMAGGVVAPELLPDDVAAALMEVLPDPAEREQFLLAVSQRFEDVDAKRIGEIAEVETAEACRRELRAAGRDDLAAQVRRVSLISDQLGYDVTAPRFDQSSRRLGVKGTRTVGSDLLIVISRNEANVGARDSGWFLVVCRVYPDDSASVLGWTTHAVLGPRLPVDAMTRGGWRAAAVPLSEWELAPGLPPCDGRA
jgi:hypothetical protein